jgi:TonB-dependent receptor
MKNVRILAFLLAITMFGSVLMRAQSTVGHGTVVGAVADIAGGVLPGARVTLDPSGQSAVADGQGNFILSNVAAGVYTVKVDAIGFQTFTAQITVVGGSTVTEQAVMKVSSATQEVAVYADREHGEVESMNEQQTAENILEVLPAEVITSLPNTNIADAVGRLPGVSLERDEGEGKYVQIRGTEPRLSNTTIDGVNVPSPESGVRNIKLDVIPAELVNSIEVSKTLVPNQDGDAIGGSVNLVTRTAGEQPFYSVSVMGGHTPIILGGNSNIDQFAASVGQRFGASRRLGVFLGGSYDHNARGIDDIEPGPGTTQLNGEASSGPFYAVVPTVDYREYHYDRTRYGFAGSVDYRFSPETTLIVRGLFSDFQDFGGKWIYTPNINSWDTPTTSSDPSNNFTYQDSPRNPDYQIGSLSANVKHVSGPWVFDATAAFSRSRADDQDFPAANFQGPSGIAFSVDTSNPFRPKFNITNGVDIHDPNTYNIQNISFNKDHSAQINLQGSFDATRAYTWKGHLGTWQAGAKLRNAHKFNDVNDQRFDITAASGVGPFTLASVQGSFHTSDYYNGTYDYYTKGVTSSFDKITAAYYNNVSAFGINPNKSPRYVFNLHELIPAQYIMDTIDIGKVRFTGGIRLEETLSDAFVNTYSYSTGTFASALGKKTNNYVDFMPNAQIRYNFAVNSNLRVIYGRGIARPNYGDLIPNLTINGTKNQVSAGNPNLLPTRANNFDVLGEHYFNTVGVVQAGFFYKQISNPIVTTQRLLPTTDPNYPGYVETQPINLPSAHIGGLELGWQQHLKSLPGFLKGAGINANYAYSFSQAKFPYVDPNGNSVTSDRALPRQAPNTFNVNPTFDTRKLSVRFGLSYNQANIYAYNYTGLVGDTTVNGPKGPTGDNYLYSHTEVDAQVGYQLPYGLKLSAAGLNLKNEVFGFYQGSTQYPIQREYYHPTYSFSLKWTSNGDVR